VRPGTDASGGSESIKRIGYQIKCRNISASAFSFLKAGILRIPFELCNFSDFNNSWRDGVKSKSPVFKFIPLQSYTFSKVNNSAIYYLNLAPSIVTRRFKPQ
jgi:hypothetical protein